MTSHSDDTRLNESPGPSAANSYPEDFADWPIKRRNDFFAAEAKAWRAKRDAAGKPPGDAARRPDVGLYPLRWHGETDDTPLQAWLVLKTLPEVGTALLSGQWGIYKTFAAIDLARAVMTKTPFAGRAVIRQGGALFIAAEGQGEVRVRLQGVAIEKASGVGPGAEAIDPAHMPFAWIDYCPRLTGDKAADELRKIVDAAARGMEEKFGLPLAVVIIDTLMPAAGFRDANDSAETQRVMNVLADVARAAKTLVLAVDHFGKDVSTGTRNSSAKEGAVDAVLALLGDRNLAGTVSNPRVAIRKVRGAPTGAEIPFVMRPVVIYENAGYDSVSTLVVDWNGQGDTSKAPPAIVKAKRLPNSLAIFKKALDFTLANSGKRLRPFADGPEVVAAERETVRIEFLKTYPANNEKAKGVAFGRCVKDAIALGLMNARDLDPAESGETFFWALE
jgi:hypothetical protein